ncbi:hypothetical protein [Haloferax gibbonsii]|uniref:hypothetical protein n=1 Tax=Haloferax gibbonsii TaxID=35746 RepID=UPI0012694030|nr:hypothetical protein [Haloferax gibbonsii]
MSDVVLKGELHTSMGDLEEEKELVKEGFDTLVLEGQASESEYGWSDGWFQISISALFWIIGRVYVSKDILRDLAEVQETGLVFTRDADSDLLENTPFFMQVFSALVFYTLVPGSVAAGIIFPKLWGAVILFCGFALPVLGIRIYNTQRSKGDKNRDKIIADKIADAAEEGDSVLAIVGESHSEGVKKHLPDSIDPDVRPPAYSRLSKPHVKEVAFPFFEMILVLYSLFLVVSSVMLRLAQFAPQL